MSGVIGAINSGSNILTVNSQGTDDSGMKAMVLWHFITVPGAGAGGTDLHAQIVDVYSSIDGALG